MCVHTMYIDHNRLRLLGILDVVVMKLVISILKFTLILVVLLINHRGRIRILFSLEHLCIVGRPLTLRYSCKFLLVACKRQLALMPFLLGQYDFFLHFNDVINLCYSYNFTIMHHFHSTTMKQLTFQQSFKSNVHLRLHQINLKKINSFKLTIVP